MSTERKSYRIVSSESLDQSFTGVDEKIRRAGLELIDDVKDRGADFFSLIQEKPILKENAARVLADIHDASSHFHGIWNQSRQEKTIAKTLASARLFNTLTSRARKIQSNFSIIDTFHLDDLTNQLSKVEMHDHNDLSFIAKIMREAANQHTHEKSWIYVTLPTFARQPYGRCLIMTVELPGFPYPAVITQPTFLDGRRTLLHTHGQNWSFSAPLGGENNTHLNTMWSASGPQTIFPLNCYDRRFYDANNVVAIPPRTIHGISRAATKTKEVKRFGEESCLHIYFPDASLADELKQSPFLQENPRFFMDFDMVVFDTKSKDIWTGSKGAWPCRSGACDGVCFKENDPRQEHLDPQLVYQWLLTSHFLTPEKFEF